MITQNQIKNNSKSGHKWCTYPIPDYDNFEKEDEKVEEPRTSRELPGTSQMKEDKIKWRTENKRQGQEDNEARNQEKGRGKERSRNQIVKKIIFWI